MYEDKATSFSTDEFWSFNNLLDASHKQIHIKWITHLNEHSPILCFVCHGEQIHGEHKGRPVNRELWTSMVTKLKGAATDRRFPTHHVMNAFGILYPQYWCQGSTEEMFNKHLRTLMDAYGHGKILGEGDNKMLILLKDRDAIMSQHGLFKACMKSNSRAAILPPYDVNPLTKVWWVLDSNNLTQNFG